MWANLAWAPNARNGPAAAPRGLRKRTFSATIRGPRPPEGRARKRDVGRRRMDGQNPYRTQDAGGLRKENVGEKTRLAGWVHRRRDHGGLIFIDLRDRWGITQVTFHPKSEEVFAAAEELRPEWSISIKGEVVERPEGNENPELPTGAGEGQATASRALTPSEPPQPARQ